MCRLVCIEQYLITDFVFMYGVFWGLLGSVPEFEVACTIAMIQHCERSGHVKCEHVAREAITEHPSNAVTI